jgi:hypothetical protein
MLTGRSAKSGVSLIRLPRPARVEAYESASEEIEGLLRGLPGIVAIYRTGSVSVPGISDLDRIAVIRAGAPLPSVWSRLGDEVRYVAMHGPLLVDLETFRRHRWFAHLEPLDAVFGTPVELEGRPVPDYSEPLIGAESLLASLLSTIKQVSTGLFKVRPSLCQLHTVRHALALARLDRSAAPAAWNLADEVEKLRSTWFTSWQRDRAELTRAVALDAAPALLEALAVLGVRTERAGEPPAEMRLGDPWSNVALVSAATGAGQVTGTPRLRVPIVRSARATELLWRTARPRIALHPGVLSLLAGTGTEEQRAFRSTRNALVQSYRDFLAEYGRDYSGIGLASPFLGN